MPDCTISTDERLSVVNITDRVEETLPSNLSGTVTVFVEHSTAGIAVNEAKSRLRVE